VFAELKDPVRRKIERYGLARQIEARHFFPTVGAAVDAFRAKTGAGWAGTGTVDGTAAGPGEPPAVPAPRPRASAEKPVPRPGP
jgi:hypothetical protein